MSLNTTILVRNDVFTRIDNNAEFNTAMRSAIMELVNQVAPSNAGPVVASSAASTIEAYQASAVRAVAVVGVDLGPFTGSLKPVTELDLLASWAEKLGMVVRKKADYVHPKKGTGKGKGKKGTQAAQATTVPTQPGSPAQAEPLVVVENVTDGGTELVPA